MANKERKFNKYMQNTIAHAASFAIRSLFGQAPVEVEHTANLLADLQPTTRDKAIALAGETPKAVSDALGDQADHQAGRTTTTRG